MYVAKSLCLVKPNAWTHTPHCGILFLLINMFKLNYLCKPILPFYQTATLI